MIFAAFILLAIAGALFKPINSGTVARVTDRESSSVGFGIFYMMVNIGGFIGPFVASLIYRNGWDNVFYISIAAIALNFVIVAFRITSYNVCYTKLLRYSNNFKGHPRRGDHISVSQKSAGSGRSLHHKSEHTGKFRRVSYNFV